MAGWLIPQAIGLVHDRTLPADGYAWAMLMAILCAVAILAGHHSRPPPVRAFTWRVDQRRLLQGALVLSLFGSIFNALIRELPDELLRPASGGWSGLPVLYHFFAVPQTFGFAIAALTYARTRSPLALAIAVYDFAWFAGIIFLSGRRTFTIEIILIVVLSAWFGRRWVAPRSIAAVGIVAATLMVTSVGNFRALTGAAYGGVDGRLPTWEEFTSIDFVGNLLTISEGGYREELYTAIYDVAGAQTSTTFNLGASYWNALVFMYVPAQLLGAGFKDALTIALPDQAARVYGFRATAGNTHTGFADAFLAFWFFGAAVFFVIARFMRSLYVAAMNGHTYAQLAYMLMIAYGLEAITHQTAYFFAQWLHFAMFTLPVLYWARIQPRRSGAPVMVGQTAAAAGRA